VEGNADRNLIFPRNVGVAGGIERGTGLEIIDTFWEGLGTHG